MAGAGLSFQDGRMPIAATCFALGLAWLLFMAEVPRGGFLRAQRIVRRRTAVAWSLLAMAGPAIAWSWAELAVPVPEGYEPPPVLATAHRQVRPSPYRTDLGRVLPVYAPVTEATAEELAAVESQKSVANLICTDGPGLLYNCHGWVFTGGRHWVDGNHVDQIIADNGYRQVSEPRAGDLIVYRSGQQVVHTGVVRAADAFGVLIESKWDVRGRYVHTPEYQDYCSDFSYYRSDRVGHVLATSEQAPLPSAGTTTTTPAQ